MPSKLPPYVHKVTNRHGKTYYYLRCHRETKHEKKTVRLPDINDPEFWSVYAEVRNLPKPKPSKTSTRSLDTEWGNSPEWKQLSHRTKVDWKRYRKRILEELGTVEVRDLKPKHVLELRDKHSNTPATANNLVACLRSMLAWSVVRGWRDHNPCRDIKPLKSGIPYRPWPREIIERASQDLRRELWWVAATALYTGQRQADVLRMAKRSISGNELTVRQQKTSKSLIVPIHQKLRPVLEEALAASPEDCLTILTNSRGRPWTPDGFKTSWTKHRPAYLEGYVFHGLRKSAVVFLLEAGCTVAEVAAVTGQSFQMVEHYSLEVNQKRLASAAILQWEKNE